MKNKKWLIMDNRASRWFISLFWPPKASQSEGYLETQKWALDYNPTRDGDDYALTMEYAQGRYEEVINVSETLDKKLDDVARTSLAIGVIIATLARALGAETPLGKSPLLIFAVFSFASSVLVAIRSRSSTSLEAPMQPRELLKVMDEHPDLLIGKVKGLVASSYHVAMIKTDATNAWKVKQLSRASNALIFGVALLILLLLSTPNSSPGSHSPNKSETSVPANPTRDLPGALRAGQS